MARGKILLIFGVIGLLFIASTTIKVKANPGITHDFVTLDSCDSTSTWTTVGIGRISLNTIDYKQGTGAINIFKTGSANVAFGASKTITSTDFRNKLLVVWIYFNSQATLDRLAKAQVRIYDSAGNYAYFNIQKQVGWQAFRRIGNSPDGTSATPPSYSAIVRIELYFETTSTSDTISAGSIVMDFWHLGQYLIVSGAPSNNPDNFAKIYSYDQANALGLVESSGSTYIIYSALVFGDGVTTSWFADAGCQAVIKGKDANRHAIISKKYAYIQFGTKLGTSGGTSGCQIRWENGDWWHDGSGTWYLYVYSSKLSGSIYWYNVDASSEVISSDLTDLSGYFVFDGSLKNTLISTGIYGKIGSSGNDNVVIPYAKANSYYPGGGWRIENNIYRTQVIQWDPTMTKKAYITGNPSIYDSFWLEAGDLVTDIGASYNVYYYYSMPIYVVDKNGNPIPSATVTVTNNAGTSKSGTTNSNGYVFIDYLLARQYNVQSSTVTIVTEGEPFHIQVKDSYGNNLLDTYIYVKEYKEWYLKPAYERLSIELKTDKGSYQLNENVIVEAIPTDYLGITIKGLSIKANITKPDGTVVTIQLKDDGVSPDQVANDGIYTGQFTSTDKVGTYFVNVNTTIYGNVVTAKTSFYVGSIEQKIEAVNQSITSKIMNVNTSLSKLIGNVNLSIITQLGKVNVSLADLIRSSNMSIISNLLNVNTTLADLIRSGNLNVTNLINNMNVTIGDLIRSSNMSIIKQITNSTSNITVLINNTKVDLEGKLSDILSKLATAGTGGSSTTVTSGPSYPTTMMFWPNASVDIPVIVMSLLVFMFGIMLYKKHKEKRRWVYTRD